MHPRRKPVHQSVPRTVPCTRAHLRRQRLPSVILPRCLPGPAMPHCRRDPFPIIRLNLPPTPSICT